MDKATDRTAQIRDLNDCFRVGDASIPGRRMMTIGVQELLQGDAVKTAILMRVVAGFNHFDAGNDPHVSTTSVHSSSIAKSCSGRSIITRLTCSTVQTTRQTITQDHSRSHHHAGRRILMAQKAGKSCQRQAIETTDEGIDPDQRLTKTDRTQNLPDRDVFIR